MTCDMNSHLDLAIEGRVEDSSANSLSVRTMEDGSLYAGKHVGATPHLLPLRRGVNGKGM